MATEKVSDVSSEIPLPSIDQRQRPFIIGQRRTHVFIDAPLSCQNENERQESAQLNAINGTGPKKNGNQNKTKHDENLNSAQCRAKDVVAEPAQSGSANTTAGSIKSGGDGSNIVTPKSSVATADGEKRTAASGESSTDRGQTAVTSSTAATEKAKTAAAVSATTVVTSVEVVASSSASRTNADGEKQPLSADDHGEKKSTPAVAERNQASEKESVTSGLHAGEQLTGGVRPEVDTAGEKPPSKTEKKKKAMKKNGKKQSPVGNVAKQPAATDLTTSARNESASTVDLVDSGKNLEQEEINEAEAMERLGKLRAVTKQLREAVDEAKAINDEVEESSVKVERLKSSVDHHQHHHRLDHDKGQLHQQADDETTTSDLNTEPVSKAKQSRSEKKARKSLSKMGLKQVNGITQVTIRRKKSVMFIIQRPDVYVNSSSETYIIFGEARIEDADERAKQEAARNITSTADNVVRSLTKPTAEVTTGEHESDEETVDEVGIDSKDIDLVMSQAGVTRSRAIRALKDNSNDIVNAIMALTT